MQTGSPINIATGETVTISNTSNRAVQYSVGFPGAGEVFFDVLPGASFQLRSDGGAVVNVNIHGQSPMGIRAAGD